MALTGLPRSAATPVPSVRYRGTSPTHPTDNLGTQSKDWRTPGAYAAVDIMAPRGTMVVATEDMSIYRLGSAQGGLAFYAKGVSGTEYWYGHLGSYSSRLRSVSASHPVRVRRGEVVGNVHSDHLHFAAMGANAAAIASTPQTATPSLADLPKQGAAFWPSPDIPGIPQFPQDVPGFDKVVGGIQDKITGGVGIPNPFEALGWLSKNWDRALMVGGGFILFIIGLILLGNKLGIVSRTRAGNVVNLIEYGPSVQRASRSNLHTKTVHDVSSEPRRPSSGYNPSESEIPY